MKYKGIISIILVMIFGFGLVACSDNSVNEDEKPSIGEEESRTSELLELAKDIINDGDYNAAKTILEKILENEVAKELYDDITNYLNAEELFDNGELEKALDAIKDFNYKDVTDTLKEDFEKLLNLIEEKIKALEIASVNGGNNQGGNNETDDEVVVPKNIFVNVDKAINTNKFNDARAYLYEIDKNVLSQTDKSKYAWYEAEIVKRERAFLVSNAQTILSNHGFSKIGSSEFIQNVNVGLPELNNKKLCHIVESGDYGSPAEFYYDYMSGRMYHIEQGFWYIVNEDFKNLTPKDSEMFEASEQHRQYLKSRVK